MIPEAELTPADEQQQDPEPESSEAPGGPTDQVGGNQPQGQQPGNQQQDGDQSSAGGGEGQQEGKPDKGV